MNADLIICLKEIPSRRSWVVAGPRLRAVRMQPGVLSGDTWING